MLATLLMILMATGYAASLSFSPRCCHDADVFRLIIFMLYHYAADDAAALLSLMPHAYAIFASPAIARHSFIFATDIAMPPALAIITLPLPAITFVATLLMPRLLHCHVITRAPLHADITAPYADCHYASMIARHFRQRAAATLRRYYFSPCFTYRHWACELKSHATDDIFQPCQLTITLIIAHYADAITSFAITAMPLIWPYPLIIFVSIYGDTPSPAATLPAPLRYAIAISFADAMLLLLILHAAAAIRHA